MSKGEASAKVVKAYQEMSQQAEEAKRLEDELKGSDIAGVIDKCNELQDSCNEEIRKALAEMGITDVVIQIQVVGSEEEESKPTQKRTRKEKRYVNPHTGEEVITKGPNHKTLKAWKEKHGKDEVEGWVTK